MHGRPEVELLPLDTEIERTLREASMAEQRGGSQNIPIVATDRP